MRRVATCPALLGLLLAFFMAPYQHVHQAQGRDHEAGGDDDSPVVHVHPYGISIPAEEDSGSRTVVSHKEHVAWSLDSFTATIQNGFVPFVQTESSITFFVPSKSFVPMEIVETRGHDLPQLALSAPPFTSCLACLSTPVVVSACWSVLTITHPDQLSLRRCCSL